MRRQLFICDDDDNLGGKEVENTHKDKVETSQEVQNPSRRRLLKFLAAGGAVTAVSLLPGKWSSPSIKTGVLPAHAQVTPGRYEVRCSDGVDTEPGEGEVTFFFSADAYDTGLGQPMAGVSLTLTLTVNGSSPSVSATTNASGTAFFQITVIDNIAGFVTLATVTFTNQAVYGTDSCSINVALPT